MRTSLRFLVMCMALSFLFVAYASAQKSPPAQESGQAAGVTPAAPTVHEHTAHQHGKSGDTAGGKERHERMQAHHEEMMAEMKAMDARLTEKVAAMNAAGGNDKIEAMAAVINELVAQRKTMQEHMMSRHENMKSQCCGMKGDMKGSKKGGMKGGMQCDMMGHQGKSHDQ